MLTDAGFGLRLSNPLQQLEVPPVSIDRRV